MAAYVDPPEVHVDRTIAALADRQHGVVDHDQLLDLGLSRGAITRRIDAGRLHPVFRGVYAVGRADLTGQGRTMAAVLACGRAAALSHRSAAALWDLLPTAHGRIHVTVATRGGRADRAALAIHRPRRPLFEQERTVHAGIPVTTVARTLFDLADSVHPATLERAAAQAEALRVFDLCAIEAVIDANPGRRRARARLRSLLATFDRAPTRSELERRFLDLCREHGLPRPLVNTVVAGLEVDFFWPAARLVVETDGFEHHGTRTAFERDRERDALLARRGIRVLRFTYRQVMERPDEVVAALTGALG